MQAQEQLTPSQGQGAIFFFIFFNKSLVLKFGKSVQTHYFPDLDFIVFGAIPQECDPSLRVNTTWVAWGAHKFQGFQEIFLLQKKQHETLLITSRKVQTKFNIYISKQKEPQGCNGHFLGWMKGKLEWIDNFAWKLKGK